LVAAVAFVGALRYRRLGFALLGAVLLVLALPGADQFSGHLVSGLRAQDRAAAMRLGELRNAAEIISRHPWFGVGWGDGSQIELVTTLGVSNIYLTLAERAGLIALAVYAATLLVLARTLWPAVRARLRDPADDGLLLGLVAALIGTQIAGMVDHHFVRFPHLVSLLWLVAGLAVAAARLPSEQRDTKPPGRGLTGSPAGL
jgi:O-antigen ligase